MAVLLFIIFIVKVYAVPVGPTVTEVGNTTLTPAAAQKVNMTGNGTKAGGYIYTINLDSEEQNSRWKAYVGNVTGSLVLQDADGWSIYNWTLNTIVGEVYATRNSTTISWGDIRCANRTHIGNEEIALNHTSNPDDNITTTFNTKNHTSFILVLVKKPKNKVNQILSILLN